MPYTQSRVASSGIGAKPLPGTSSFGEESGAVCGADWSGVGVTGIASGALGSADAVGGGAGRSEMPGDDENGVKTSTATTAPTSVTATVAAVMMRPRCLGFLVTLWAAVPNGGGGSSDRLAAGCDVVPGSGGGGN